MWSLLPPPPDNSQLIYMNSERKMMDVIELLIWNVWSTTVVLETELIWRQTQLLKNSMNHLKNCGYLIERSCFSWKTPSAMKMSGEREFKDRHQTKKEKEGFVLPFRSQLNPSVLCCIIVGSGRISGQHLMDCTGRLRLVESFCRAYGRQTGPGEGMQQQHVSCRLFLLSAVISSFLSLAAFLFFYMGDTRVCNQTADSLTLQGHFSL